MHIKLQLPPTFTVSRVRSVCIHPSRSFLYCGLASGVIQCWDYGGGGGQQVLEMVGHCGPVRALHCHHTMQLMASCSDDMRVVVWNLSTHKLMFTLRGHTDYVRQVRFHPIYPWLVTGSDDCTLKIWNWQSRSLVYTVSGHQHWVISLALHATKDLMVSASVDGSVRLWDYSSLRNRTCNVGGHSDLSSLFGLVEVVCEHVWEGFTGKLGWVVFHPTQEMVVVGDGRMVRMYSISTYREVGSLLGHEGEIVGGVWGVVGGEGIRDSLVTVGKDKKVKVWNYHSGLCRATHSTEYKFSGVVGHDKLGYVVAWGDKGVVLFKVWKERPAMAVHMHHLYYVRNGTIRHLNVDKNNEKVLVTLTGVKESQLVSLEYNPTEHGLIVNSCVKGNNHSYQLFFIIEGGNMKPKIKKSPGRCSVWATPNRFALLDTTSQMVVKNLDNQNVNFGGFSTGFLLPKSETKSVQKIPTCDKLFAGGDAGHVILRDGDFIILYDIIKKRRVSSGQFVSVKHLLWSQDKSLLAMFSKHHLWLCDKNLKVLQTVKSRNTVKSVAWCQDTSTLLYTTDNQLMYLLVSGDSGVVATIPEPLYIAMVRQNMVVFLTRKEQVKVMAINTAEYRFKAAVLDGKEVEILSLINSGKLMGQSMLQFLRSAGRPELSLSFIQDPLSRFCLAMESNNLSAALDAANILDTSETWMNLANLAMLNGDLSMAEVSYQKCRAYTKLMFLYLVTGQRDKLTKLARIMRVKGDFSGVYQVYLVTGEKGDAADLLEFGGQKQLAELNRRQNCANLKPPEAFLEDGSNWAKVEDVETRKISNKEVVKEAYRDQLQETLEKNCESNGIMDDNFASKEDLIEKPTCIDPDSSSHSSSGQGATYQYEDITHGDVPDLENVMASLHKKFNIVNFLPLKQILFNIYVTPPFLPCFPSLPPLPLPAPLSTSHLDTLLARAHSLTTAGKFTSALEQYRSTLLAATLAMDMQDKLIYMCADYAVTLAMEMERKKSGKTSPLEKIRQCQLAILATKFNLLPVHQVLLLRSAISVCLKVGNLLSAKVLAKSLLSLSPSPEVSRFARSVLINPAEPEDMFPMDAIVNTNPVICGGDFIVLDGLVARCYLCRAQFGQVYSGQLCPVDRVARIGHAE